MNFEIEWENLKIVVFLKVYCLINTLYTIQNLEMSWKYYVNMHLCCNECDYLILKEKQHETYFSLSCIRFLKSKGVD